MQNCNKSKVYYHIKMILIADQAGRAGKQYLSVKTYEYVKIPKFQTN